ncbi:hypothetical protein OEZ85_003004 [Tetradesmus obliquus]|uniref:TLC domain-containing protein n=1 Tax=Tetradesmus obliquus TaxID=3088 RepID=A0ABY8TZ98_TETOB|nr:hypothetical protein OEZ85_003004 [Tetradesmus obliquus]
MIVASTGLTLQDLPTNPSAACATPKVQQAFLRCKMTGPSPSCCKGLDAVFVYSSVSAGCLCYPQVLYKVIETAAAASLDVPGLLQQCVARFAMRADWAMKQHTSCPAIGLDASVSSLALQMGDVPLIPSNSSNPRPTWAWKNLLQTGDLMEQQPELVHALAAGPVLGYSCLKLVMLTITCIAPVFFVLHHGILMRFSAQYKQLEPGQQLVSCQHAAYVVVFGLQLIPQTLLAMQAFFKLWTAEYAAGSELPVLLGVVVMARVALYLVEACVRSVVRWSWVLFLHHSLYFVVLVVAIWSQSPCAFMIGLVLDLFACHEMPLYLVLLGYRLKWPQRTTKSLMTFALGYYTITRLLQTAMVLYMIIVWAGYPAVRTTPAFIVVATLFGAFSVIQAYTLVIYRAIGRKLGENKKGDQLADDETAAEEA